MEEQQPKIEKKLGKFSQDKPINPDRLHEELKAALGEKLDKLETGVLIPIEKTDENGKTIIVGYKEKEAQIQVTLTNPTSADLEAVERILKDHDHTQLSTRDQKQKDATEAYARLSATDFAAIRKLIPDVKFIPADEGGNVGSTPVTREEVDGVKAQLAALIDLMEDWQRLMVAARG